MSNVVSINRGRPALGVFHAVSCQDAASMERDGQLYYDLNELKSKTRTTVEIQFEDGIWFLADPETDLTPLRQ